MRMQTLDWPQYVAPEIAKIMTQKNGAKMLPGRLPSMKERVQNAMQLEQYRNRVLSQLLQRYVAIAGRSIPQPHQLLDELNIHAADESDAADINASASGSKLLGNCQEAFIVSMPWVGFAERPKNGIWEYVRVNYVEELTVEEFSVSEYLETFKQLLINSLVPFVLELDIEPFNAHFPRMTRTSSIGHGLRFLNRHLSAELFPTPESMESLFQFLRVHTYRGETVMLNDRIASFARICPHLVKAEEALLKLPDDTPISSFAYEFQDGARA